MLKLAALASGPGKDDDAVMTHEISALSSRAEPASSSAQAAASPAPMSTLATAASVPSALTSSSSKEKDIVMTDAKKSLAGKAVASGSHSAAFSNSSFSFMQEISKSRLSFSSVSNQPKRNFDIPMAPRLSSSSSLDPAHLRAMFLPLPGQDSSAAATGKQADATKKSTLKG